MPIIFIVLISVVGSLILFGVIVSIIFYFNNLSYMNNLRDSQIRSLNRYISLIRSRLNILENKVSSYNRFFIVTKKNKIIKTNFTKK